MSAKILLAASMDWPFPARLGHAFAALGARIEAVCPRGTPLGLASGLPPGPARLHRFSYWRPLTTLARALIAAAPDLVIPCDDLMAELLWRLGETRGEFSALLAGSSGNRDAFPMLAARNDFLRAAQAAGVAVAETVSLAGEADLDAAIARLGLPLVVKADGSWGGDGVAIARDRDAARTALCGFSRASRRAALVRAVKRGEPHWLVRARFPVAARPGAQRFIPGHPATSAIACRQGRLLAANHFDVVVSQGTGPATVVARTDCPQMEAAASCIVARFGLSGFYGLDYMRDADGKVFLLEINPRATPTSHLALGPGHDLAAALLRACGHAAADRPAVTANARIALFPQEIRRDPQSPHLAGAYHDVPSGGGGPAGVPPPALTHFSQGFPGPSGLGAAADPKPR